MGGGEKGSDREREREREEGVRVKRRKGGGERSIHQTSILHYY